MPTPMDDKNGARSSRFRLSVPGIAWAVFLALLVFGVPKVFRIYIDRGFDLPSATVKLVKCSEWVIVHAPLLLVLMSAGWIMPDAYRRDETSQRWSAWGIASLIPLILLVLTLLALILPLFVGSNMDRLRG